MVSQTGPRVVRSNSCKGPVYLGKEPKKAKGPNENFGANKCYLGPNILNLAPKGPTWQPWSRVSVMAELRRNHETNWSWGTYCGQGRSQDFSKGGLKLWKQKALKRKNCLWVQQPRKAHNLWINSWLYSQLKLGVLPTKLPSCFFD